CRLEVVRGLVQLPLAEVEDPTSEEQDVTGVLVRLELERPLQIGFGLRERLQLFIGKAPEEVGPDEVGLLGEAGVQARLRRFPVLDFQVTNRNEKLGPEMARLQAEGTVEGVHGLLPVAAPILFLADQEVVQRARRRQRGGQVPVLPRLLLSSELLQQVRPPQVVRPGLKAEQAGMVQDPERFLTSFLALVTGERLLAPDAGQQQAQG